MEYSFQDLGLPSVGEFNISSMRAHRNRIVRAIGAFLESKANYLPGDRWTVDSIRRIAEYTSVQEGSNTVNMSMIEIGVRNGYYNTLVMERQLPSGRVGLPLTRLWIPERHDAIERMLQQRYGRDASRLGSLHNQHWTFSL